MSDVLQLKESDMEIHTLSNEELLSLLIGRKTAAKLYSGRLASLVFPDDGAPARKKLLVAIEFGKRVMREDLCRGRALGSPREVSDYLVMHFLGKEYESFVVVFLDNQHRIIAIDEMFRGTIDGASVYPREIVGAVLRRKAAACIFAHNHPSGVAEPSQADQRLTMRLKSALGVIDVRVLDHFVVAGAQTVSFAERGLL
jgi:DNA repair protein RadC